MPDVFSANPIVAIVACTPSGVIGLGGAMPWKLTTDLRRFKSLTMGGTLVMGRKTYDSIGKPLPGRETIVLSRTPPETLPVERLHYALSVENAFEIAETLAQSIYVVGGAEIYKLFSDRIDQWWVTRVFSNVAGDTRIDLDLRQFALIEQSRHPQTARDSVPTEFQKWIKKNSVPKI